MTKVMKKAQVGDNVPKGGRVKDSFLAKLVSKRSKLDDYVDSAAKWITASNTMKFKAQTLSK